MLPLRREQPPLLAALVGFFYHTVWTCPSFFGFFGPGRLDGVLSPILSVRGQAWDREGAEGLQRGYNDGTGRGQRGYREGTSMVWYNIA